MPLSPAQWVALAESIPRRPLNVALHSYVLDTVRPNVDGTDSLNIPETHRDLLGDARGNHEGSAAFNTRIRQLATWFASGDPRVRAIPSGPGDTVQTSASLLQRFVRQGERAFAKGVPLHNYKQECARDLAECGFSVYLQIPRKDYYDAVASDPRQMAAGEPLLDIVLRRRIDPATFSFTERIGGRLAETVTTSDRHLGEQATRSGPGVGKALAYLKLSEAIDAGDPTTWDLSVQVAEVWTDDEGALVFMDAGKGAELKDSKGIASVPLAERILAVWPNVQGHNPHYIAKMGPQPWHGPLDQMCALTNMRNYLATMQLIQASGAAYRHWQLITKATGEDVSHIIPRDAVPEHVLYDLSKPPPDMGPDTEWKLAPFEFQPGIKELYMQVREDHEAAGASVARLSGHSVNQNTPVATVDFIDAMAQAEFGDWSRALDLQAQQSWHDLLRYLRVHHKDRVFVEDKARDAEHDPTSFLSTTTAITGADVITEDVEIETDRRSRLSKIADYRLFTEMQVNGHMEYETGVALGYVPGVEDAEAELEAIYVSQQRRALVEARIHVAQQQEIAALSPPAPVDIPAARPNVAGGQRMDPRGTGTGRGPENVSDSALATGATDLARSA